MPPSPNETPLPERILDAAESVLRRHGPEKTNVVDIARVLGMSHGNIYRHFPSKKALVDAVAIRWLGAVTTPLAVIAADTARPAPERLTAWFNALRAAKQHKIRDDPELFRVYHKYVLTMQDLVDEHVAKLLGQIASIIAEGIASGAFSPTLDAPAAARSFLQATAMFHHPALLMQDPPATDADARAVLALLLTGLRDGPAKTLSAPRP